MSNITGRDIVYKTLKFMKPDRIALAKGSDGDMHYVSCNFPSTTLENGGRLDEWGCVWESKNQNLEDQGQVMKHPLSDWDQFDRYTFPDPTADDRFENVKKGLEKIDRNSKFVVGNLNHGPMHLLDHLRGFEEYLMDLMLYPERTELLLDGIFTFLSHLVKKYAENKIDAVIMYDDQAIQTGPLFSLELWDKYFKPRYKKLFDLVHDCGMIAYVHACGDIRHHIIRLYECGVDIIDNKQPELWMESDEVRQMRGKISYSTCIDIQTRIHSVNVDEIEAEVSRLIKTISTEDGGFVGTYYHQPDLKIPAEKIQRMIQAYKDFRWR